MSYFSDSQKSHKKLMEHYQWRANVVGNNNAFYQEYINLRNYHQAVLYKQDYEKRVLSKQERNSVFNHWCKK